MRALSSAYGKGTKGAAYIGASHSSSRASPDAALPKIGPDSHSFLQSYCPLYTQRFFAFDPFGRNFRNGLVKYGFAIEASGCPFSGRVVVADRPMGYLG